MIRQIVAFHGKMGSGKDTAATYLINRLQTIQFPNLSTCKEVSIHQVSFAEALRRSLCYLLSRSPNYRIDYENTLSETDKAQIIPAFALKDVDMNKEFLHLFNNSWNAVLKIQRQELDGDLEKKIAQSVKIFTSLIQTNQCTIGKALQILGTEIGRNIWDENLWVKLALHQICNYFATPSRSEYLFTIITDLRFPNEYHALTHFDPTIVTRPTLIVFIDATQRLSLKDKKNQGRDVKHASETMLPLDPTNSHLKIIDNNSTLENFFSNLDQHFQTSIFDFILKRKQVHNTSFVILLILVFLFLLCWC